MTGYDFHQLLETRGYPFPYTLASVSLTETTSGHVAECFVLVDNGKEYFNGQRILLSAGERPNALATLVPLTERILLKMYKGSLRNGTSAPGNPQLSTQVSFDVRPIDVIAQLINSGRFEKHLRWMAGKSASPQCRANISKLL